MADALDSKSSIRKNVWVQVPPPVLLKPLPHNDLRQRLFRFQLSRFPLS